MWRAHDGMGWWMVFGSLLWIAFWGVVIYAIARFVIGDRSASGDARDGAARPIDIARRRYAAGEIDREEFLRLQDDLESSQSP